MMRAFYQLVGGVLLCGLMTGCGGDSNGGGGGPNGDPRKPTVNDYTGTAFDFAGTWQGTTQFTYDGKTEPGDLAVQIQQGSGEISFGLSLAPNKGNGVSYSLNIQGQLKKNRVVDSYQADIGKIGQGALKLEGVGVGNVEIKMLGYNKLQIYGAITMPGEDLTFASEITSNRVEPLPPEGDKYASTPFNFTAAVWKGSGVVISRGQEQSCQVQVTFNQSSQLIGFRIVINLQGSPPIELMLPTYQIVGNQLIATNNRAVGLIGKGGLTLNDPQMGQMKIDVQSPSKIKLQGKMLDGSGGYNSLTADLSL